MVTSTIHNSGRRFRSKICVGGTCTPPKTNTRRKLQSHIRVGWHKVHRNHTRLGLHTDTSASVTTSIYRQITQTVQPQTKEKQNQPYPSIPIIYEAKTKYATQSSSAPMLDKKGKKFIQQLCGTFFRKSSQQHNDMPNQHHRITINKSDRINNETNTAAVGLHCNARGRHNHIHQQRHEYRSPLRCKLP